MTAYFSRAICSIILARLENFSINSTADARKLKVPVGSPDCITALNQFGSQPRVERRLIEGRIGLDVHKLAGLPTLLFAIINSFHRESVTDFRQDNFFGLQQGSSHAGFFFSGRSLYAGVRQHVPELFRLCRLCRYPGAAGEL